MQINLVQKNLISADVAGNLKIAKNVLQNMKETDRACLTVFSDCFLQGIKNDDILKTFPQIMQKQGLQMEHLSQFIHTGSKKANIATVQPAMRQLLALAQG